MLVLVKLVLSDLRSSGIDLQSNAARGSLAGDQALPGLAALADNIHGVAGRNVSEGIYRV